MPSSLLADNEFSNPLSDAPIPQVPTFQDRYEFGVFVVDLLAARGRHIVAELEWISVETNIAETANEASEALSDEVQHALAALPEEFRTAVVLCDVVGLSYDEIADAQAIPVGTVRSRIHRGRRLLRTALS